MTGLRDEAVASCRICAGMCSLRLARDAAGRIVSARGDKSNPLTRGYACIRGLRRGVVSISHGWGGLPGDPPDATDPHSAGVNVNRLTTTRSGLDPINAMPRLTALPVRIVPLH